MESPIQLSEHFTLNDLIFSETAQRKHIDNSVDETTANKLRWLAARLEEVWLIVGSFHINSAYRCLELNRAVGSSDTSQHRKAEAADCRSTCGVSPYRMCDLMNSSGVRFDQVIHEFGSWMHVSFVEVGTPRHSLLTIDHENGTRRGLFK